MSDYDIDESDIPDLPDEELERVVARWLGWTLTERGADGGQTPHHYEVVPPDGGERQMGAPAYTSDPAAFGGLIRRIPWHRGGWQLVGDRMQPPPDRMRAMTEAAAVLAVRGVEPREPTDD